MAFDLKAGLIKVRAFIAALAPITPIKTDDELPGLIDAIIADSELFGWFEKKLAKADEGVLEIETEPPIALQASLEARGQRWERIIALLPTIFELVKLFRG